MKTPRRLFYGLAVVLMWIGVTAAFVQKRHEGWATVSVANRIAAGVKENSASAGEVNRLIWNAQCCEMIGIAAVSLALLSCGIATWRRESHPWVWVAIVVLLSLYILLELMMV